jgi:hypothetical protein
MQRSKRLRFPSMLGPFHFIPQFNVSLQFATHYRFLIPGPLPIYLTLISLAYLLCRQAQKRESWQAELTEENQIHRTKQQTIKWENIEMRLELAQSQAECEKAKTEVHSLRLQLRSYSQPTGGQSKAYVEGIVIKRKILQLPDSQPKDVKQK